MKLDKFVQECKTGDIILCSGTKWYSRIIEWFFNSPISHVGLIYRDVNTAQIYFFQSELRNGAKGVRLTPIHILLDDYKSGRYYALYYRQLKVNRNKKFHNIVNYILNITLKKNYDTDPFDWLRIVIRHDFGKIQKTNSFICSALVAFAYIQLGYLDQYVSWSTLTPNQFSSQNNHHLQFKCTLTTDILLEK
jgi:hypothetical protein